MSTPQLPDGLLATLLDWDEDSSDEHFDALDRLFESLSTPEKIMALARSWWSDADHDVRALGFDLLAVRTEDFSWHVPPLVEAVDALALDTTHVNVRWSAVNALGVTSDERVLYPLLRFAGDPNADVRWQVVRGIPAGIEVLPEEAVRALLKLMRDPDAQIRDWATFTLGHHGKNDTPEIRDAFVERLDDPEEDTAGEAAVALAIRRDPRIVPVLERVLATMDVGNLYVDAAGELTDPRLLPLLRKLKADGWRDHTDSDLALDHALEHYTSPLPPLN